MQETSRKALVLFSGGQDSAICLAWALTNFEKVETVGFDYGQRHAVELGARNNLRRAFADRFSAWAERLGPDELVDLGGLGRISESALTRDIDIAEPAEGPPNTFVPGRNLVFLTMAAALAYRRGAGVLVGGMCGVDRADYPDCRAPALEAQVTALRLGMDFDVSLQTPLLEKTKAQSWSFAEEIGGEKLVSLINEMSHTCYRGVRGERFPWGYGCGDCPACIQRAEGWSAYQDASA